MDEQSMAVHAADNYCDEWRSVGIILASVFTTSAGDV